MSGNGARTGTKVTASIRKQTRKALVLVLIEWSVAVTGATLLGTVAHLTVAATRLTTGATSLGSVWLFLSPSL